MPKKEDLEKLGSIAFLLGEKSLPEKIEKEDYDKYKSIFTDEVIETTRNNELPEDDNSNTQPSLDDLEDIDEDSTQSDNNNSQNDSIIDEEMALDDLLASLDDELMPPKTENNETNKEEGVEETQEDDTNLDDILSDLDEDPTVVEPQIENNSDNIQDNELNLDDLLSESEEATNTQEQEESQDDGTNLDDILSDLDEDPTVVEPQIENNSDNIQDNELNLDDLLSESEEATNTQEQEESQDDGTNLDDILSDLDEDPTVVEPQIENNSDNIQDNELNLDDLLSDLDEASSTSEVTEKREGDNELFDATLDLEDDISEEDKNKLLPPPSIADKLVGSKYKNISPDLDQDKILSYIDELPNLLKFDVLDAIINEKLEQNAMASLLKALAKKKSPDDISLIMKRASLVGSIESDRKKLTKLISIPRGLKEYGSVINLSAIIAVVFVVLFILAHQFLYKPLISNMYFKRGYEELNQGSYGNSEINFNKGDKLRPKQLKWYNKYARAYIDREVFNSAYDKIEGALQINPSNFETKITFGYYYRMKGEEEISPNDYTSGQSLYDDMLETITDKKEIETVIDEKGLLFISRARTLFEPQYFDMAYSNYARLVQMNEESILARKMGMLVRIYQNQYDKVVALQKRIELIEPGYFDNLVYPELASYYLSNEKYYEARLLFEEILRKYPKNIPSLLGYANYYMLVQNYSMAKNILLEHALPIYDENPFLDGKELVHNMLGQIYYNTKQFGSAISEFKRALEINATYPDANYNIGNIYFYKDNDYSKAKEHYLLATAGTPPNLRSTQLVYNLSWIHYLDAEYDSAFNGFYSLFAKESTNTIISYALGNSLLHMDRENLANGFYKNALETILEERMKLGTMSMRTDRDFYIIAYMAALYNNIGVAFAYNYSKGGDIKDQQEAFKYFVLAAEYFDQVRTSNVSLELMHDRIVNIEDQNIGIASYNLMAMQARRPLITTVAIDTYIPKNMYQLK